MSGKAIQKRMTVLIDWSIMKWKCPGKWEYSTGSNMIQYAITYFEDSQIRLHPPGSIPMLTDAWHENTYRLMARSTDIHYPIIYIHMYTARIRDYMSGLTPKAQSRRLCALDTTATQRKIITTIAEIKLNERSMSLAHYVSYPSEHKA